MKLSDAQTKLDPLVDEAKQRLDALQRKIVDVSGYVYGTSASLTRQLGEVSENEEAAESLEAARSIVDQGAEVLRELREEGALGLFWRIEDFEPHWQKYVKQPDNEANQTDVIETWRTLVMPKVRWLAENSGNEVFDDALSAVEQAGSDNVPAELAEHMDTLPDIMDDIDQRVQDVVEHMTGRIGQLEADD